ncbi:ABC transporter ATP-binding protein [Oxynema aestuarii]|jgi:subfamily B ATP-binding cassette protein MsbA|uniref:ABC transporter ATP-binding protein n=1 Tax=Oxynema aestuarii AP17 TaxID=2064643 RepID=A0A6H1TX51_9CYAN|nr:ABC transporter ATP-binding protein [Oxynema aestuarii]QIZ71172.1 ABC transporter ATP-binding protein [Oxynema aestuarii AP17]RMH76965.1 MAG: ABC transporter ATP-binding protein [Cyanobacteria bacterium J007]
MSPNKLLLQYAFQRPFLLAVTVLLGWAGALFNGVSTTLIVPVLLVFLGQDLMLQQSPAVVKAVSSVFTGIPEQYQLAVMTAAILLAILLKNITSIASTVFGGYLSRSVVKNIRLSGIKLVLDLELDYYSKTKIGDIINCINQEINRTANAIRTGIRMTTQMITILIYLAFLISISWQLTLASTLVLVCLPLVSQYFVKRSKKYGQILSDKSRVYSGSFLEALNGIRLVKSTSNEEYEYLKLKQAIEEREKAEMDSQINFALINPINEMTGLLGLFAIVLLGRAFFSEQINALSANLLPYLLFLYKLLPVLGQLNNSRSEFANFVPSTILVNNFLRRDDKLLLENGSLPYRGFKEGIGFNGIWFSYPGHTEVVLKDINLWLPKGSTLALVGGSGAGKSTLADLLPRFYDPTEGCITIDGKDIREFDMRSLRRAMGIVSQDTFLFNDSVRKNIAYARPDATDEEIVEAAKRANAYEFIVDLPKGFDTILGDRGIMLSGGQRQRIAIARALLSNPEILILDEATSALDTVSEHLVQQALETLRRDRTTLVIAHRLSTVQNADCIAVMDKGRVVETGTHHELLEKGGYYTNLYAMQFSEDTRDLIKQARNETLIGTSYEIRTRLNPMIGFLRLLVDDIVDSSDERNELILESYESALRLLHTLEFLENNARNQIRITSADLEAEKL